MNSEIRVLIVDDEPHSREILDHLLRIDGEVRILGKCQNVREAVEATLAHKPDLIFLDIEMPGGSGFDYVEQIRSLNLSPEVVFVTAYNQYAIKAIKHSAFDYLLKPVDIDDLSFTLRRYRECATKQSFGEKTDNLLKHIAEVGKVRFSFRNGMVFVNPEEIIWCQANGSYTNIHFKNGKSELVSLPLKEVEELLKEYPFFRASRSALINLKYLSRIDRRHKLCIIQYEDISIQVSVTPVNLKLLESAS